MKLSRTLFGVLAEAILQAGAKKATKILTPDLVVKATRRGKRRRNERTTTMLVTVGRPNYAERQFISACRKAREPFPVKRLLLKWDRP